MLGLGFGLFTVALVIVIGWAISSLFLMLACRICSTPVPRFLWAMALTLAVAVTVVVVEVVAALLMGMTAPGGFFNTATSASPLSLLAIPIHGAIAASFYRALLPTTFLRGFAVWFVHAVIVVVVTIVLAVGLGLVFGGLAMSGGMAH